MSNETSPSRSAPKPPRRRKLLWVLAAVLLVLAVVVVWVWLSVKKAVDTLQSYDFVRTTTLQRTSLDESVTVNGTVTAGSETSVTVSESAKIYKIAAVNVAVGDRVNKGDVIATLDTADLLDQIAKAEKSYAETIQQAQTGYDRAVSSYNTAVVQHDNKLIDLKEKITQADETLSKARTAQTDAQSACDSAAAAYNRINGAYQTAAASISTFQDSNDRAAAALNEALTAVNSAAARYNTTMIAARAEYEASGTLADPAALQNAAASLLSAYYAYNGNTGASTVDPAGVEAELVSVGVTMPVVAPVAHADSAEGRAEDAAARLKDAKNNVSDPALGYTGFDQLAAARTQAETALNQAKATLEQAKTAVQNAEQNVKAAHDSYDSEKNSTQLTSLAQNVEDAKTKLTSARETPDSLTNLRKTLDSCTLTAAGSGTVTALNAVVGSVCSGAVATIKNTDDLLVKVTVPADNVPRLKEGLQCRISSDATGDAVIAGTLTQIDPAANDQGTFGATVKVLDAAPDLLVGIPAKVQIVLSSTQNVFVVPIDAVGTADDGSRYVLRRTGGEGAAMTFEEVTVTVGASNDYYTEISGSTLRAGDVVRSSADLTEGLSSTAAAEAAGAMNGPGGEGGGRPIEFTVEEADVAQGAPE